MNANYLEVSGRTYYAFEEPDFVGPMPVVKAEAQPLSTVEKYNEGQIEAKFWRRQFGRVVTRRQQKFDWFFGVIMPAICFFFDPVVFRGWDEGDGMLAKYRIFAYLLSGTAIMAMAAWLLWGEQLKALTAPLAGLFFTSGILAAMIGIALFPLSLIGSIFIIGFLGFTPFFTAIVFLRNAFRSRRVAAEHLSRAL
ncbi:MAG TPA: hypothetical protein PLP21_03430 [Pyrinomonadaceae bacterium]|nr:hypothetical protein [Acidobacteriota bacterium]HQZ95341.1 hypothetical protein [Pyrinomonadaceae bacterium]